MGSYTDLTINGYPVIESKSYVIPEMMTIFQESDKKIFPRKLSERNELVWGSVDSDEYYDEIGVTYSCEAWKVTDRLNVMGFTLTRVKQEFEEVRLSEIEKYTVWGESSEGNWWEKELELFEELTFEKYFKAIKAIISKRIRLYEVDERDPNIDPIIKKMSDSNGDYDIGFLCLDLRSLVRIFCEFVPKNSLVVQDITEVVYAGYYEKEDNVRSDTIYELTAGYIQNSPTIILTEGSTDIEILKNSLSVLYPHLKDYYTFLDYSFSNSRGGAGNLVSIIKSFIGAGIVNRIIAVFDNDSAAFDARRNLNSLNLPSNIAVCNYPDLKILESYSTIGPNGHTRLNINGLSASIELYTGFDIIENGEKYPVQWKGYVESIRKYQGEVMHKSKIQKLFIKKINHCKQHPEEIDKYDWSGLKAIFEMIFNSFE